MNHSLTSTTAQPGARLGMLAAPLFRAIERSHLAACAALVILSLALFLPGFTSLPPMDRDEPRFAQASKQMLETHDFVAIRFQDEARNKKPVGIYWLQSASVALAQALGFDQARTTISFYRIPSLIGAIAAVLLTYWTGLGWLDRRHALMAAASLASTVLLGVEAHLAKTDAVLTATVVAALGALGRVWMARADSTTPARGISFVLWLAVAAGTLDKGPLTLMILALAALALSIKERSARWLVPLADWRAIALAILVVAPWFVAIAIDTHGTFFTDAVGKDMLGKVAGAREAHGAPPGSYIVAALVTLWPLAPLAILAVPFAWRDRRGDATAFLLAWLVPSWLVFEAVPTKLPHYVLPLYPAIALLVALAIQRGGLGLERVWRKVAAAWLPIFAMLIAIAAPIATFVYGDRAEPWGAVIALVATGCALWAVLRLARGGAGEAVASAVAASLFIAIAAYGFAVPHLMAFQLSPRLAAMLSRSLCMPQALATAGYNEPSLVFLTRTDLRMMEGADAGRFLAEPGCKAAFVDIRQEPSFAKASAALNRTPQLLGRVWGVNLNGGHHMDIGVYTNGG